ncbi:MAG: type II toxin-antitoxin system RelE/ParE family toxin [Saprospiraceae bacterium]|nr:type II toxin-antitoxin system RelE/ParE family toxin [Saprospiraceae bacterium]
MIKSFGDGETDKIWKGTRFSKLPNQIQQVARRKLRMINNATNLNDLRIPPANKLEKLKGSLKNYQSIRINEQLRIIFRWRTSDAYEVKIVHYNE